MKRIIVLLICILVHKTFGQDIRINELMYAPSGGEPEWIELYNASSDSVNINHWTINDKNGVRYPVTPSDRFIGPHSYLVLTNTNAFADFHPEAIGKYIVVEWSQYFLVNAGDTVVVRDANKRLVDSVYYAPSWGGSGGKSLERISAADSSRLKSNWATCVDPRGSTPGRKNSVTVNEYDLSLSSFSAAYYASESKAIFKAVVKNIGAKPIPSFSFDVFIDRNNDTVAQPEEFLLSAFETGLDPGDSGRLVIEKEIENPGRYNAIASVVNSPDDDTSNNTSVAPIRFSFPAKSVVVNEIMYAPSGGEPEWVELFNTTEDSIVLDGFSLSDNSEAKARINKTDFVVPPNGYAVIADDSTFFNFHNGLSGKVAVVAIPSLNNSGDAVVIRDDAGVTMDSVCYSPSWGGNSGGRSLERILATGHSNEPHNFETCTDFARSTPGKINSVSPRRFDLAVGSISYTPLHPGAGSKVTIYAFIVNHGTGSGGPAVVSLFDDVNKDSIMTEDERIDSVILRNLVPGDSTQVSLTVQELKAGRNTIGLSIGYQQDEKPSNNTRIFDLIAGLPAAAVVINEIMYAPRSPEQEWLELYNTCDAAVDISNFKITTHAGSSKIESGAMILPRDYTVICKDSSVSRLHYHVNNLLLQSCPSLNNNGDGIGLYDNSGGLIDSVDYVPSYGGKNGRSLERIDHFQGSDSTNWKESADSTGATPGKFNSVALLPFDVAVMRISIPSAAASPGETIGISVVLSNAGRNSTADFSVGLNVVRVVDSALVYSDERNSGTLLPPRDSLVLNFSFSPNKPGLYRIAARVTLSNDARFSNDTCSACMNVSQPPRSVIINEIMYSAGSMGEYFEIFNSSPDKIDLSRWTFHTHSADLKPLCDSTRIVSGGEFFVIASDSSVLKFAGDTNMVHISKSMSLRDDGDCIVVRDPTGTIVDSVQYYPSWHNADIAAKAGRSLERINPSLPSNERSSWSTCVSPSGGTPGSTNSLFQSPGRAASSVSVSPNPFSPDGDGHDDFTFISYSFSVTSVKVRVRIFDSIGRLIATPTDNLILPSRGQVVWDGRDGSGKIVKFGLYILFMEVTGPDGSTISTYKSPLVVAKRMR